MLKLKFFASVIAVLLITLFACKENLVIINETVELPFGESKAIKDADLVLTLKKVEDSRCPKDAVCIWEGMVVVEIEVVHDEKHSQNLKLGLVPTTFNTNISHFDTLDNHIYQLLEVNPYPSAGNPTKQEDYSIKLKVESL